MTEKERLERIFRHEEVDRPACICPGGMMNMITTGLMDACGITWPEAHTDAEMMARKHEVLTSGYVPKFDFDVDIQKKVIKIRKPTLEDQTPYEDQAKEQAGFDLSFDALRTVRFVPGTATAVIHGNEVIQIEAGDTTNVLYGVAIDIGTTTVVCTLVDLLTGKELAAGVRLSCLVKPGCDLEVELMQRERKHEVLTSGYVPEFDFDVDIQKKSH